MPYKPIERVYRSMPIMRDAGDQYKVRGYASTFDKYVLWDDPDEPIYEQIERTAFDQADMEDVILQFDHCGRVFARTSNNTLNLSIDDHGLLVEADLSKTESARGLWEEIRAGMITGMSFGFTIEPDGCRYDRKASTNIISRVRKVYDVSAVSIPANAGTDINARCALDGSILRAREESRRRELRTRLLVARCKLLTMEVK